MNTKAAERPGIRNRAGLQRIINDLSKNPDLLSLPSVLVEFLSLSEGASMDARQIETSLSRDPSLVAQLLQEAGSSFYGVGNVRTINQAINVLGTQRVISLVMNVWFRQFMNQRRPKIDFDAFWEHSLAVAAASRELASVVAPNRKEECYAAGLLHDIGILVLERFSEDTLAAAIRLAETKDLPLHVAESKVTGFDHTEVGYRLAAQWQLPDSCQQATRFHHSPQEDRLCFVTTAIVSVAEVIAVRCGYSFLGTSSIEFDPQVLKVLRLKEEDLERTHRCMMEAVLQAQMRSQ
ncbi:MAG: HDOD domain-containing protein [Fimbriimonadaceae bacterium]